MCGYEECRGALQMEVYRQKVWKGKEKKGEALIQILRFTHNFDSVKTKTEATDFIVKFPPCRPTEVTICCWVLMRVSPRRSPRSTC